MNNPNQPGYVIPSQQRMQTEMMGQQQQQRDAEPAVENADPDPAEHQMNANTQRIQQVRFVNSRCQIKTAAC
jgi:hypothetical protein